MLAVTWKVMFLEVGFDISNEYMANRTPCQTTFSYAKYVCSVECLLRIGNGMKDCIEYVLSQDAGHMKV